MEAHEIYLQRFTDRLPVVPWLWSSSSSATHTDIFVIDPVWNEMLPRIGALVHRSVALSFYRSASGKKQFRATVLLGDEMMNSQLHRRAFGTPHSVAMLCFEEVPRTFHSKARRSASCGVIGLAHEVLQREADNTNVPIIRCILGAVIEASLVLLGCTERQERTELGRTIERDFEDSEDGFGRSLADWRPAREWLQAG